MGSIFDDIDSLNPLHEQYERLERLIRPYRELEAQMARLIEPHAELYKYALESASPFAQRHLEAMRLLQPSVLSELERVRAAIESPALRQIEAVIQPQKRFAEQLQRAISPYSDLFDSLRKNVQSHAELYQQIAERLDPLRKMLERLEELDITVTEDGRVTVGRNTVSAGDIESALDSLPESTEDVESFIGQFIDWLKRLSEPVRYAILYVLLPYLVTIIGNLTTPLYEDWWKEHSQLDKRVVKKEIVRKAQEQFDPSDLTAFRFVYATSLNVRSDPKRNAEILDTLITGKVVKVIERRRSWTYIEYYDDHLEENVTGWVFSRYIRKFVK